MEPGQVETVVPRKTKELSRALFIESLVGNIKEKYFFEKKIGSGGYGAVYLAKNKQTGRCRQYAIKWARSATLNLTYTQYRH